jgi:hypothetical protein
VVNVFLKFNYPLPKGNDCVMHTCLEVQLAALGSISPAELRLHPPVDVTDNLVMNLPEMFV